MYLLSLWFGERLDVLQKSKSFTLFFLECYFHMVYVVLLGKNAACLKYSQWNWILNICHIICRPWSMS
jgi:hypothetical protein